RGEIGGLKEIMEKSENLGMQTFDGALYKLYKEGRISLEEAIKNADSPNNLRLRISLDDNATKVRNSSLDLSLEVEEEPEEEGQEG
ncbi:MAG: type IV pili twitching motility protein PilT, partial [Methylococcales bacterium]